MADNEAGRDQRAPAVGRARMHVAQGLDWAALRDWELIDAALDGGPPRVIAPHQRRLIEQELPVLELDVVPDGEIEQFFNGDAHQEEPKEEAAVTDEMVREAQALREKDDYDPSPTRYSRACLICCIENPRQRAVFSRCGHIVCYSCAVENARSAATDGKCVFCRTKSRFVKIFEDEYGSEKKKGVNDGNGSKTDENGNN